MAVMSARSLLPSNGRRPVSISNSTTPMAHTSERAQRRPGRLFRAPCRRWCRLSFRSGSAALADELGNAEVEELDLARRVKMMLAGLMSRWTMPASWRARPRARDLYRDVACLVERQRTALDTLLQRLAFVVRHRHEQAAVGRLVDFVNRADVRVVEGRGGLGFVNQAFLGVASLVRLAAGTSARRDRLRRRSSPCRRRPSRPRRACSRMR